MLAAMLVMNSSAGDSSRRLIRELDVSLSFLDGPPAELRHKLVFHAPTQDPAAQQEGIHLVTVGFDS